MKETNKPINKISTEKLESNIDQLKIDKNIAIDFAQTSLNLEPVLGLISISDKNISLEESIVFTGIGILTVGFYTLALYCNLKAKTFEEQLNYRNSNQEDQPKVYQKEINHTR